MLAWDAYTVCMSRNACVKNSILTGVSLEHTGNNGNTS